MAPVQVRVNLTMGASLVGAVSTVLGLLLLWSIRAHGIWVALFLVPILLVATAPALARQAARERDRGLLWLLLLALLLKLLGSLVRYWVAVRIYGGVVDAIEYHEYGTRLSEQFRTGVFDTGLGSLTSTNFIRFFTGLVYTVIGPSIYAGFLLYSWLAFWGMFFFYRAFTIAVPGGNRRSYARLLFFLPSLLYWPSSIGKDAWMVFTLGVAAFGFARVLSGRTWRGLALAGGALWLAALVRPHVAGMAVLAMVVAYIVARTREGRPSLAVKILAVPALIVLTGLLLSQTTTFLKNQGLEPEDGVTSVLEKNAGRTNKGGSSFDTTSSGISPARLPLAVVTILYRPFPFEAHNAQAMMTALENTILLGLTIARGRSIWNAIRKFRRLPYVTFVTVYGCLFVVAFSSLSNFGIIARERVQLLPFFLVLLAVPAVGARRRRQRGQVSHSNPRPHDRQLAHA
jgi:hypothetical protein